MLINSGLKLNEEKLQMFENELKVNYQLIIKNLCLHITEECLKMI